MGVQNRRRDQIIAGRSGDRVLIGSYDEHLYCLSARNGSVLWKAKTNGPVHSTPGIADGMAFVAAVTKSFARFVFRMGKRFSTFQFRGVHGCIAGGAIRFAYYGTFDNEVLGVDLQKRQIAWDMNTRSGNFLFIRQRQ